MGRAGGQRIGDPLGMRHAMPGLAQPALVGFLCLGAVLAGASYLTAGTFMAALWGNGASPVIVTVPQPGSPAVQATGNRGDAVAFALAGVPGLGTRRLPAREVSGLLSSWLDGDTALPADLLPAFFELRGPPPPAVAAELGRLAPGTAVERGPAWIDQARAAAMRWQHVARAGSGLVAGAALGLVALASRAGLSGQRPVVETVHALGGSDGMIAWHVSLRAGWLSLAGALPGTLCALGLLLAGARLVAPAPLEGATAQAGPWSALGALPAPLWWWAGCVPASCVAIAWATAQATVRLWLRRLP